MGEIKRGALVEKGKGPMAEKHCYNDLFKKKEKMKTREDKRMVKLDFLFLFQNYSFWTYIGKYHHIHFWCMVVPLGP